MDFIRAESVSHATSLLAGDPWGTKVIAGGTALVLMMKHRLVMPDRLISIDGLAELAEIRTSEQAIRIGGTARLSAVAAHPDIQRHLPGLATATSMVGNVRIRNAATIGGNVAEADYASDPPAVMVSMGARAHVTGPEGQRTIPIGDLITGFYTTSLADGEIITAIEVPWSAGQRSVYEKYRTRSSEDRPCVGVAATGRFAADGAVESLSIVVGATAPIPQSLPEATAEVLGSRLDDDAIAHLADRYSTELEAMDDQRGSAWYRKRAVGVFVSRALRRLYDDAQQDVA